MYGIFLLDSKYFTSFNHVVLFIKKKNERMSTSTKAKWAAEKKSTKNRWLIIRMKKLLQYKLKSTGFTL